jgi:hypothetical protein
MDEGGRSVLSDTSFWRYFKVHLETILQMVCRYRQVRKFLWHKISDCVFVNDRRLEKMFIIIHHVPEGLGVFPFP